VVVPSTGGQREANAVIAFEAFTKRFGAQRAVEDLTLAVDAGEVVALIGPNGSGKTTSLKAAAGLLQPSAGRVLLGNPGRPAIDPAARRLLSYLPQRVAFPESLSGREVLEFFRSLRQSSPERIDQVLRFAALNGASGRAVGTYSGGMLQRLGLAVAMLPDAPILLLDEPTAALDPDGLCAFYGLVEQRQRAGKAVFFTSHQIGDVERLADRFAVLVEGRLVASLNQTELRDRLAERGVMRLRLGADPMSVLREVRTVAPRALAVGDELIVPGGAAIRPAVLDLVRAAGAPIRGLTAEEGRLDTFYKELVGAHS
jgi:Cu-processing system ATP-binding protein